MNALLLFSMFSFGECWDWYCDLPWYWEIAGLYVALLAWVAVFYPVSCLMQYFDNRNTKPAQCSFSNSSSSSNSSVATSSQTSLSNSYNINPAPVVKPTSPATPKPSANNCSHPIINSYNTKPEPAKKLERRRSSYDEERADRQHEFENRLREQEKRQREYEKRQEERENRQREKEEKQERYQRLLEEYESEMISISLKYDYWSSISGWLPQIDVIQVSRSEARELISGGKEAMKGMSNFYCYDKAKNFRYELWQEFYKSRPKWSDA